ncbi:ABC transporter ATP-binding protein [Methylobacter psychrophilus]|uniref:ABC transporter ATP-binding protein n=1 Tax=Methylobacter psychrophilus TaxID=96941 RepID=UPI0021D4BFDA|nr:ATP-binding cassette domain-containing protein [Methylobacter psychrophilus]
MMNIQINIDSKTYPAIAQARHHVAIADFKLSLKSGEFVCLVGPSGCGKTTLLNIIAGLDNDYEGDIFVGQAHSHPKIGYIFQNPRLLPWRTVRENIELVLDGNQSPTVIDPLLEVMQLTQSQHVYPERLSVGMSRRVSIIRAFAVDPDVLLMDEPFVSLDAPTARQVRELLLTLWQERPHTVLFVTHDLREAITMADRLIFLSAAPMSVISEITVPISRSERNNESTIEAFRQNLINNYPEIKQLL